MSPQALRRRLLSSSPRTRHLAALGLLIAACSFASYESVIPFGKLNNPDDGVLALSVDGTTLWAMDWSAPDGAYSPKLKVFDTATNNIVGSAWWGSSWEPRAVAPANEAGYEDVAWVLHANGYRIRWNANLMGYSEIEVPIPLTGATAADGRMYCDMDHDDGGVQFITTIDFVGADIDAYLYREPSEGVWERVELPTLNGKCGRVSWDAPANQVAVLDDDLEELLVFDAGTLVDEGTVDLSAVGGALMDFAVVGGHAVVARKIPGPASDSLVLVDNTGTVLDTAYLAGVQSTYIHIEGGAELQAYWTGADTSPIKYTAGYWTIED